MSANRTLAPFLFCVLAGSALAQETGLPGNATSLRETHGDWTVSCAIVTSSDGSAKRCVLSQQQIAPQTRQRALTIELRADGEGASGTLILPFGLSLDKGIAYQLDDNEPGVPQRFRTCLPVGCVVDIHFDNRTVSSLKSGKVLKVNAAADGGKEMAFSISLAGFTGAYERVVTLVK